MGFSFQRYREIFRLNKETYKQDYDTFMANLSDVEKEQLKHNTALKRKKKLAIKTKRVRYRFQFDEVSREIANFRDSFVIYQFQLDFYLIKA